MYEPIIERSLQGHKDSITSISFNPSSKLRYQKQGPTSEQLASASLEGKLTIWKLNGCSSNECSEKKTSALSLVSAHAKTLSPSLLKVTRDPFIMFPILHQVNF